MPARSRNVADCNGEGQQCQKQEVVLDTLEEAMPVGDSPLPVARKRGRSCLPFDVLPGAPRQQEIGHLAVADPRFSHARPLVLVRLKKAKS